MRPGENITDVIGHPHTPPLAPHDEKETFVSESSSGKSSYQACASDPSYRVRYAHYKHISLGD